MSTVIAGPVTARIFADLGADVIKIESVGGDVIRTINMNSPTAPEGQPFVAMTNSNKKFVSLNLKSAEGKQILMEMLEKADVFICNIRYASLKRLGLTYEDLRSRYPKLIYAHFSGYGYAGPDAEITAYDASAFWARNGGMIDWLPEGSKYLPVASYGFGDFCSASAFFGSIMVALFVRTQSGRGTKVCGSLQHNGIWANGSYLAASNYDFKLPWDPDQYDALNFPYKCKDGEWIYLVVDGWFGDNWAKTCRVFEFEEYIGDVRFQGTNHDIIRRGCMPELHRIIEKTMLHYTRAEWKKRFDEADYTVGEVRHTKEILKDEDAWANGYIQTAEFMNGDSAVLPTIPMKFADYNVKPIGTSKSIGYDTTEVLKDMGYSMEQIRKFKENGYIR